MHAHIEFLWPSDTLGWSFGIAKKILWRIFCLGGGGECSLRNSDRGSFRKKYTHIHTQTHLGTHTQSPRHTHTHTHPSDTTTQLLQKPHKKGWSFKKLFLFPLQGQSCGPWYINGFIKKNTDRKLAFLEKSRWKISLSTRRVQIKN